MLYTVYIDSASRILQDDVNRTLKYSDGDNSRTLKLYSALLGYSRVATRSLIARILHFPRELRNAIYDALLEVANNRDPRLDLVYYWRYFHDPWLASVYFGVTHFFHHEFVGHFFANELLERFRDTVGEHFASKGYDHAQRNPNVNLAHLATFMDKDYFGIGKSMEELSRSLDLTIEIGYNHIEHDYMSWPRYEIMNISELSKTISPLLKIPAVRRGNVFGEAHAGAAYANARRINLRIYDNFDEEPEVEYLKPIVRLVVRLCRRLREKGFLATFQYRNDAQEIGLTYEAEDRQVDWDHHHQLFVESQIETAPGQRALSEHVWSLFKEVISATQ